MIYNYKYDFFKISTIELKRKDCIKRKKRNSNGSKPSRRKAIISKFDPSHHCLIDGDNSNDIEKFHP